MVKGDNSSNDPPMNWNYIGNAAAVALLRSHVAHGSLRQAYLFSGPSGVGRRTLALRFAQAVNCLNPPQAGEFCGVCRACHLLAEMRHPDLEIVAAEQRGGILRVEQIRELQHRLSLSPYEGRYRIALILRFEEANLNAQNALLKTLEEPPPKVILLITVEDSENLLPTIVSRCEVVRLRPLAAEALAQTLIEKQAAEAPLAAQVARLAGGRAGIALRLLHHPEERQRQFQVIEDHLRLLGSSYLDRFATAERYARELNKAEITLLLDAWLAFWRDVTLYAHQDRQHLTYPDFQDAVAAIVAKIGEERSLQALRQIHQMRQVLQGNVNLRLALEVLFLNLPNLSLPQSATQSALEEAQTP
ncbi:MAG: DNA polymerase III subunit delta' [Anaerolineae bacterium]|jgi:DNA polymerase-3 subunit delta'|nr:MAG: DNA polymerase III subunit delta' [Anaerolineae bacterium]